MNCITTYTGKHFDPVHPQMDKIDIKDVAHALSLTCRGNGHVKTFFSVGQHCINCAMEARERGYSARVVMACLVHDASESYMSDVPRPFKRTLVEYQKAEEVIIDLVYHKFVGSSLTKEEASLVKRIDDDMLYFDLRELLNEMPEGEEPKLKRPISFEFVPFGEIEERYLKLYEECRVQLI